MRQFETELESLNVAVVIVTFQHGPIVDAYIRQTGVGWPVLRDPSLALYRAYGMNRGRWWHIFGPPAWWVYAKLLARGRRLRMPSADVTQLGGDVLVDPNGIVRLHHVGKGPADRPAVQSLVDVVRKSAGPPQDL